MARGRARRRPLLGVGLGLLALGLSVACSSSTTGTRASSPPAASAAPASLLFVQDAKAATLDLAAGSLTLAGVDPQITYFADRPARKAGHASTRDVIDRWGALFGTDPPNAGLQAVDASGTAAPVVLELTGAPTFEAAGTLAFKVRADGASRPAGRQSLRDVSLFIDGGNPSGLPNGVAATSSTAMHTVTVVNRSSSFRNLVVYQNPASVQSYGVQSLAWLTAYSWPGSTVEFAWNEDYSVVWGPDGLLLPGVTFEGTQTVAADPYGSPNNYFSLSGPGAQAFPLALTAVGGSAPPGYLTVMSGPNVPFGTDVGIAMNGSPVFAASAPAPLTEARYRVDRPQYFLAAGAYQQGQVLDVPAINGETPLIFSGTNDLHVTLTASGSWLFAAH